jgi:SP family arabinose:H+ symporter-like MFS transporter
MESSTLSATEIQAGKQRGFYVTVTAAVAAIAGFLFGYEGSIMSAAIPFMNDQFHLTPGMLGFIMGSSTIGCVFGPFAGGWSCDKIGREKTLLVCALFVGLGTLVDSLATDLMIPGLGTVSTLAVFASFRILSGFGMGLGSIAAPMYIAEVAPFHQRGQLGISYQLALVIGSVAAPLVAYPISLYASPETAWRWMFASGLGAVTLLFVFLFLLTPSPRWLASKGRFDEALVILKKIHSSDVADEELVEIKKSVREEQGGWSELFHPGVRLALLVGLLLAFFNNWTGWSAMGGYIPLLLEEGGVKNHSAAILQYAITYASMAIMTTISMLLVDRVGRRPLWIFASVLMAVTTLATGLVFQIHATGSIVLVMLCLCTIPHGIALGGLPWLMMSELFPNRVRARAVAITTTFLWLVIFSCGQMFPIFQGISQRHLGSSAGVFWLFTIICVLSTLFGFTIMPETKGRTLEDIAGSWQKKKPGGVPRTGIKSASVFP